MFIHSEGVGLGGRDFVCIGYIQSKADCRHKIYQIVVKIGEVIMTIAFLLAVNVAVFLIFRAIRLPDC